MTTSTSHPQGGRTVRYVHDFVKAYRKARQWHCDPVRSTIAAARFALTGDSGNFPTHGGWQYSRIRRKNHG